MDAFSQGKKKKIRVPHVYVILLMIIALCIILTHIIPAGQYSRIQLESGRMVVDPNNFSYVEGNPLGLFDFLLAVPKGMAQTAEIIFFIFIVGGSFAIIQATGAIDAGLGKVTKSMSGKEKLIIPIIMFTFSLGGAVFGMAEETLPFIPIMVTLSIALGFDSLVGAGIVLAGAGAGFSGAFMNPFTIGVAQEIAELPLFSGIKYRIICYASFVALTIAWMYIYAGKVKKDPNLSTMHAFDQTREDAIDITKLEEFTVKHKLVLLIVLGTIVMLIFGVTKLGWYIQEISGLFLGMGNLAGGALVVGFARGILVALTDGLIIDTILFTVATGVSKLPSVMAAGGMYIFQCLMNYPIPSGSGQAAATMPIMTPLSDIVGVTRQTAVLAFQFGDGISNIFTPTSGYFMAGLALAKIPWEKWAKWILPLILLQYLLGAILVTIAHVIQLGPF